MLSHIIALVRRFRTQLTVFRNPCLKGHGVGLHIGSRSRFWAPLEITIGDNVYIGKDVLIECNADIGNHVLIANRVAIVGRHDHDFRLVGVPVRFSPWIGASGRLGPYLEEKAVIESDVWLGYGATILSGVRIGRGAIVAAGAVVSKDIARYAIVAGNPASVVGQRFYDDETINRHEAGIRSGRFVFSERGYEHWVVQSGDMDNTHPGPDVHDRRHRSAVDHRTIPSRQY